MVARTVKCRCKSAGCGCRQDISVMSIDGFNLAAIQDVPLTAVHVPRLTNWVRKRYICFSSG